jgi:hypothetical protein
MAKVFRQGFGTVRDLDIQHKARCAGMRQYGMDSTDSAARQNQNGFIATGLDGLD